MKENRVLTIDNLTTTFESHKQKIQAVRGVSLHVDEGDILAIVGESGSGKSVTMKSVMGLLGENADVQADHLELLQKDLLSMSEKEKRKTKKSAALSEKNAEKARRTFFTFFLR